jgi:hypothetical protein
MERTKWTDDMLDQRFVAMDEKFELLFAELRLLRQEMNAGFAAIRAEMGGLRTEVRAELAAHRAEVLAFHRQILYVVVTLWVGLLALFAAQL